MPKDNVDYSNTIIYKITCKDQKIKYIYVGHTTNFIQRKYKHKINSINFKNKLNLYKIIRENGGWENWEMSEIAKYQCKNSIEAKAKEQEHYDVLNNALANETIDDKKQVSLTTLDNAFDNAFLRQILRSEMSDCNSSQISEFPKKTKTNIFSDNEMTTHDNAFLRSQIAKKYSCENCERLFNDRAGLWRHKKKCETIKDDCESCDPKKENIVLAPDKDLILLLIKENQELKKLMMEQQTLMLENNNKVLEICKNGTNNTTNTHTNSHNKAFNLNFFLNETCKNAMNIMDFAQSIQLQLSDLEAVGKAGYVEGISNIIVKKLKSLDVTERPIHCADKKREVIYIKDEDKWEKEDEDKKKIKKVINEVACKNQRLLSKYKEIHPGCNYSDSKYSDQYSKLVIEAMGGAGNNDAEKADKIVRNIVKEVVIDKSAIH
jgi:hypothetical protein